MIQVLALISLLVTVFAGAAPDQRTSVFTKVYGKRIVGGIEFKNFVYIVPNGGQNGLEIYRKTPEGLEFIRRINTRETIDDVERLGNYLLISLGCVLGIVDLSDPLTAGVWSTEPSSAGGRCTFRLQAKFLVFQKMNSAEVRIVTLDSLPFPTSTKWFSPNTRPLIDRESEMPLCSFYEKDIFTMTSVGGLIHKEKLASNVRSCTSFQNRTFFVTDRQMMAVDPSTLESTLVQETPETTLFYDAIDTDGKHLYAVEHFWNNRYPWYRTLKLFNVQLNGGLKLHEQLKQPDGLSVQRFSLSGGVNMTDGRTYSNYSFEKSAFKLNTEFSNTTKSSLLLRGNLLYSEGNRAILVFDVSNPRFPKLVGRVPTDRHYITLKRIVGDFLYVTVGNKPSQDGAIEVYDISTKTKPKLIQSVAIANLYWKKTTFADDYIAIIGDRKIESSLIETLQRGKNGLLTPFKTFLNPGKPGSSPAYNVAFRGHYMIALLHDYCLASKLWVVNLNKEEQQSELEIGWVCAGPMSVVGSKLFLSRHSNSVGSALELYDLTNPMQLNFLDHFETRNWVRGFKKAKNDWIIGAGMLMGLGISKFGTGPMSFRWEMGEDEIVAVESNENGVFALLDYSDASIAFAPWSVLDP